MRSEFHRTQLLHVLGMAYSGELAAAYAYRGHWKSVQSSSEKTGIRKIELEEWAHRRGVGRMLQKLGRKPQIFREIKMAFIGRTIGFLCHVTGWFFPMYFAGRLEHGNVKEYDMAAFHAGKLDLKGFQKELLQMSRTEKEHEDFFASQIVGHPFLPWAQILFKWGPGMKLRGSGGKPAARSPR